MAKAKKEKPFRSKHLIRVPTSEGAVFIRLSNIAAVRPLYGTASRIVLTVGGTTIDCQEDAATVASKIRA
ncbi:MAG: hypothetical protein WD073_02875 [Xanthobacteraceae bacterium]